MIQVRDLVLKAMPRGSFRRRYFARPMIFFLKWLFHEHEFHRFAERYGHMTGFDFVDQVLDYLEFSYSLRENERERIPSEGRVVIISNHPIGSLDGLALLQLVRSVRPDVKIVANEVLGALEPLQPTLLPVDNFGGKTAKENVQAIHQHLNNDQALIIFPAGVVSRFGSEGIKDKHWRSGFLRFAEATRSPILPVYVDARLSNFFYILSLVIFKLSTLWLVHEMFKLRKTCVSIRVGEIIPFSSYEQIKMPRGERVRLFRSHLYRLEKSRPGVFRTQSSVAPPENRKALRAAIKDTQLLGETTDGMEIYLYRFEPDSIVMRELGRVREVTFRAVEEGSGFRRDMDEYDTRYLHIILWDDRELEIVGAYRVCDTAEVVPKLGQEGVYSSTIYRYLDSMAPYFEQGMELGRSFVQPKYWGKRSLEYLWYGIGALTRTNPNYRYFFGAVSVSDAYPEVAKDMIVHYYTKHYSSKEPLVEPLYPYSLSAEKQAQLDEIFPGKDYRIEFKELKSRLMHMNLTVPTLLKQYSELGDPGTAVVLSNFGHDLAFSNAVDGFILVDTWNMKPARRERYLETPLPNEPEHGHTS